MEMDFYGEVSCWISPPRIQKVEENILSRRSRYQEMERNPQLDSHSDSFDNSERKNGIVFERVT